jgi:hypothetical protein
VIENVGGRLEYFSGAGEMPRFWTMGLSRLRWEGTRY